MRLTHCCSTDGQLGLGSNKDQKLPTPAKPKKTAASMLAGAFLPQESDLKLDFSATRDQ